MTVPQPQPVPEPMRQAKHPRSVAVGPYGHPFHPVLVTVPIGAWVASVVFDIVAFISTDEKSTFAEGAYWLIAIGVIGAVVAALFGLPDLLGIRRGTTAFRVGLTHMALNLGAVVLFVISFVVRHAQGNDDTSVPGFVLSLVGLAIVGGSGWLGGMLAYRYGVRVADEETQAAGYR